jgi:methylated-DNA-protein-cysteine methyltransferase-like protein
MGYFEDVQKFVRLIPRGKVATYGTVAQAAGHPGTARQVAWALRDVTAPAMPWQRVLGHGGKILMKGEPGLRQRTLLELEGVGFKGTRVDMKRHEFHFPRAATSRKRA